MFWNWNKNSEVGDKLISCLNAIEHAAYEARAASKLSASHKLLLIEKAEIEIEILKKSQNRS